MCGRRENIIENRPTLSIVTVVYNNPLGLCATLESIRRQHFTDYEVIVVDGNSTDQTTKLLNDWGSFIDLLVQEPDDGPYDAMNKGLSKARGDWLLFLNSGDYFEHPHAIDHFNKNWDEDILYGSCYFGRYGKKKLIRNRPLEAIWKGNCFSHQAAFIKNECQKSFDLSLKIVADYAFFAEAIANGRRARCLSLTISTVEADGISSDFYTRTAERYAVVKKLFPGWAVKGFYLQLVWEHGNPFKEPQLLRTMIGILFS